MKKLLVSLFALCMICGCAKQEVEIPNPMKEVTKDEMTTYGIPLWEPDGASDARYFVIEDGENQPMLEVEFTYKGKIYNYRAQATNEMKAYDMTGLYFEWDEEDDVKVGHCDAHYMGKEDDNVNGMYWMDVVPGVNYSIGCADGASKDELIAAATACFSPLQGNSDGIVEEDEIEEVEEPIAEMDYVGEWMDENQDTVTVTATDEGYDVVISIVRLAQFEGKGNDMDGAIEFVGTDPNEEEITAILYPAEDGTCTLKFTTSTWNLLPAETEFTGFTK